MYYEELNELVERMDVFAQRGNYEGVNMIFDRIFSSNVDDDCNYILKRVLEKALDSKADLLMQKKQNIIETADKFISKMQKKSYHDYSIIRDIRAAQFTACMQLGEVEKAKKYADLAITAADNAIEKLPYEVAPYQGKINILTRIGQIEEINDLLAKAEMFISTERDQKDYNKAQDSAINGIYFCYEPF